MPEAAAELLFQIISGRAEAIGGDRQNRKKEKIKKPPGKKKNKKKKNLPFSEWTTMFRRTPGCARPCWTGLTDQGTIDTGTESYRSRERLLRKKGGKVPPMERATWQNGMLLSTELSIVRLRRCLCELFCTGHDVLGTLLPHPRSALFAQTRHPSGDAGRSLRRGVRELIHQEVGPSQKITMAKSVEESKVDARSA